MERRAAVAPFARWRSRRLAVVATVVLAALGATAPSASARLTTRPAPQRFFGVSPWAGNLTSGDLTRMGQSNVGSIRFGIGWRAVQKTQGGPFDWTRPDLVMSGAAANGIRPLPFLTGAPAWYSSSPTMPPLGSSAAIDGWKAFTAAA